MKKVKQKKEPKRTHRHNGKPIRCNRPNWRKVGNKWQQLTTNAETI